MSYQICKRVSLFTNIGVKIHIFSSYVAIICRNIVIFKNIGSHMCERLHTVFLKENRLIIIVIFLLWLYSIMLLRLPLYFDNFNHKFNPEQCNLFTVQIISTKVNEPFAKLDYTSFYHTLFCYIPLHVTAVSTTVLSLVWMKKKSSEFEPNEREKRATTKTSIELLLLMKFGLALQVSFFWLPRLIGLILSSVFMWILLIYTSYTTWPFLKSAMTIMLKDLFCRKPLNAGQSENVLSATLSN